MGSSLLIRTHTLLASALLVCAGFTPCVQAQQYPQRPIKILTPVEPGGGVDVMARLIAQKLSQQMGVSVIVDNRAGAAGVIASEMLVHSPPDGYTLLMGYSSHATNPLFIKKLPYDTIKDFTPVVFAAYSPLILVVNPAVPAHSVKELIALAKSRPGQLQFASGGRGGGPFMAGLLMRQAAGVDIVHVAYKGNAPALSDVLAGHVTMMFDTINTSTPLVRTGRLRALAVTSPKRSPLVPDVPTMIEAGMPKFEVYAWFLMLSPPKTPVPIVQRLNTEINTALNQPDVRARLATDGVVVVGGTPAQADSFIRSEMTRWKSVVEASNLKDD